MIFVIGVQWCITNMLKATGELESYHEIKIQKLSTPRHVSQGNDSTVLILHVQL